MREIAPDLEDIPHASIFHPLQAEIRPHTQLVTKEIGKRIWEDFQVELPEDFLELIEDFLTEVHETYLFETEKPSQSICLNSMSSMLRILDRLGFESEESLFADINFSILRAYNLHCKELEFEVYDIFTMVAGLYKTYLEKVDATLQGERKQRFQSLFGKQFTPLASEQRAFLEELHGGEYSRLVGKLEIITSLVYYDSDNKYTFKLCEIETDAYVSDIAPVLSPAFENFKAGSDNVNDNELKSLSDSAVEMPSTRRRRKSFQE